ncbi:MAG: MBL fold metallo-hydrolase, partial [Chloroflexota bacterium]|nr:MBL fold metallo-hydrolase [Chloroflexota bacterium]
MSELRLFSLGSGSSGNGFILDTGDIAFLIDCGTAIRPAQAAIRELGIADRLAGIIVSHEHSDHVRGIPSMTRRIPYPLITTRGTFSALGSPLQCVERASGTVHIDSGVEVTFVGVSHDASEPCGFIVDACSTRIAVFTDLGIVDDTVLDALRSADIIVLESNYDWEMLRRGGYPAHLKRRIQGPAGHLSNDDCAAAIVASVSD